jgi:hypothetical protein
MCILLLCVLTLEVDIGAQTRVSGVSLVFNKNTAVSWLPDLKVEEARVQREKKTIEHLHLYKLNTPCGEMI